VEQVVEVDDLDRAVHVAVGYTDESARDALAADLDRVGVGAGGARHSADLDGDGVRLRSLFQKVEDARTDVRPAEEHGARAALRLTNLLLVAPRRIRGVAHINRDANGGIDRIGCGGGAAQADLLGNRGDAVYR